SPESLKPEQRSMFPCHLPINQRNAPTSRRPWPSSFATATILPARACPRARLAMTFHVGRQTVTSALLRLQEQHLLEIEWGGSTDQCAPPFPVSRRKREPLWQPDSPRAASPARDSSRAPHTS